MTKPRWSADNVRDYRQQCPDLEHLIEGLAICKTPVQYKRYTVGIDQYLESAQRLNIENGVPTDECLYFFRHVYVGIKNMIERRLEKEKEYRENNEPNTDSGK